MSEIGRTPPPVNLPPFPSQKRDSAGTEAPERNPKPDSTFSDALANTPAAAYTGGGARPEVRTGCVIGLDAGGTKVNAAVADLDGKVLGGGTAGPCNIASMPAAEAFKAARAACLAALVSAGKLPEDVVAVCAGVAGVSYVDRRTEFTALMQDLFHDARVAVEADYAIAFTGATGGAPGIVVIAGTGSVAYGEDGSGRGFKTGGYGYLIDDGGSGYGVGRDAISAVLHAADKTGPATVLIDRVLEALGVDDLADIVPGVYGGSISRVKIASLATVVADVAEKDDAVAKEILGYAGSNLATLASTIAGELFPNATDPFPIAMVGSLWKAGNAITVPFIRAIRQAAPTAVLAPAKESPLQGALRRAPALANISVGS
jgi:N-acetylglucosamine kinase-like BadF-type ATPase